MQVKLYTTAICPYCKRVKEFLKKNHVSFEEIDITEDETGRNELLEKTGQMLVPAIQHGEKFMIGFEELKLQELFGKKKKAA